MTGITRAEWDEVYSWVRQLVLGYRDTYEVPSSVLALARQLGLVRRNANGNTVVTKAAKEIFQ